MQQTTVIENRSPPRLRRPGGPKALTLLKPGDAAPDFMLSTVDGQPISLADTMLVFMRHLG